jgi:hypothetical protein
LWLVENPGTWKIIFSPFPKTSFFFFFLTIGGYSSPIFVKWLFPNIFVGIIFLVIHGCWRLFCSCIPVLFW